jgi:hypothetical protein
MRCWPLLGLVSKAAIQTDIVMVAKNAERIKWGMPSQRAEHLSCVRDLVAIRARSKQRALVT